MKKYSFTLVQAWSELDRHFRVHASLIQRFKHASASDVVEMLKTGCNECGQPLSAFEREALVERHCELFGRWPTELPAQASDDPRSADSQSQL